MMGRTMKLLVDLTPMRCLIWAIQSHRYIFSCLVVIVSCSFSLKSFYVIWKRIYLHRSLACRKGEVATLFNHHTHGIAHHKWVID